MTKQMVEYKFQEIIKRMPFISDKDIYYMSQDMDYIIKNQNKLSKEEKSQLLKDFLYKNIVEHQIGHTVYYYNQFDENCHLRKITLYFVEQLDFDVFMPKNTNNNYFFSECCSGDKGLGFLLKPFLQKGFNPNSLSNSVETKLYKRTYPLITQAFKHKEDAYLIKECLEYGLDPNLSFQSKDHHLDGLDLDDTFIFCNLLILSIAYDNEEIFNTLLENGADPNLGEINLNTENPDAKYYSHPVLLTMKENHYYLKKLLKYKVDFEQDLEGKNIISIAKELNNGSYNILKENL